MALDDISHRVAVPGHPAAPVSEGRGVGAGVKRGVLSRDPQRGGAQALQLGAQRPRAGHRAAPRRPLLSWRGDPHELLLVPTGVILGQALPHDRAKVEQLEVWLHHPAPHIGAHDPLWRDGSDVLVLLDPLVGLPSVVVVHAVDLIFKLNALILIEPHEERVQRDRHKRVNHEPRTVLVFDDLSRQGVVLAVDDLLDGVADRVHVVLGHGRVVGGRSRRWPPRCSG